MNLTKLILNSVPRPWLIRLSYFVRPLLIWFYKGDEVTDPIDQKSFRSFLPYGYKQLRKGVLSPSTLSLERHRSLWLYLKKETELLQNSTKIELLHIAPEQCFYSIFKKKETLNYTTFDLNSPLPRFMVISQSFHSRKMLLIVYFVIMCLNILKMTA